MNDKYEMAVEEVDNILSSILLEGDNLSSLELFKKGEEVMKEVGKKYRITFEDLSALSEIWLSLKREVLERKMKRN